MADESRQQSISNAERQLLDSLRKVGKEMLKGSPIATPPLPLISRRNLTLLLIALDVTAATLLLGATIPSEWVKRLSEVAPIVLGTALVAYTEQIRNALFSVADRPATLWFALAVLVVAFVPGHLPVKIPVIVKVGATLRVDGDRVFPERIADRRYEASSSRFVTFHGLREHVLKFELVSADEATIAPTAEFRLSAVDLIRARYAWLISAKADTAALVVPTLVKSTIEKPAGAAELQVRGVFPPLFRRFVADSGTVKTERNAQTLSIWLGAEIRQQILPFPDGSEYRFTLSTCSRDSNVVFVVRSGSNEGLKLCVK
jgi:hypothetical protein